MLHSSKLLKVAIAGLLLITISLGGFACSSNSVNSNLETLETIIKEIPGGSNSFVYWDTQAMANDSELHGLRDKWKADNETQIAGFGVASDLVTQYLQFSKNDENALVLKGDINIATVRAALENLEYNEKDWKKVEVWESTDELNWVGILEASVACGTIDRIKEVIGIAEDGDASLYSNQDLSDLLDKLPDGIIMHYQSFTEDPPHAGLIASGDSFVKKDKDTLDVTLVYKFDEPENAADSLMAVSEEVDEDYDNVEAKQDGRFVIVTAEVKIEYMV